MALKDYLTSNNIYDLYQPKCKPIGLVSIPHAGMTIPLDFLRFLTKDKNAINQDVDFKVDELIEKEKLVEKGVVIIIAKIHRACVDLNRIEENAVLNWKKNTLGIDLVTSGPTEKEYKEFLSDFHRPYYDSLKNIFDIVFKDFVKPIPAIDLHSMPSRPTEYHLKLNPSQNMKRPDLCISDLHGKSCSKAFLKLINDQLVVEGFKIGINDPYSGGNLTKYINQFSTNNVQIEINRSIYMDETRKELLSKSNKLKDILSELILNLFNKFS